MDDIELGQALFKQKANVNEVNTVSPSRPTNTTTITGKALGPSSDGMVEVDIAGNIVELETTTGVSEGDDVIINVANHTPVVTGVVGWGDAVESKTQHITFIDSGTGAGLHIHENPDDYNEDGDLWLTSGFIRFDVDGNPVSVYTPSGIQFLEAIALRIVDQEGLDTIWLGRDENYFDYDNGLYLTSSNSANFSDALLRGSTIHLDIDDGGCIVLAETTGNVYDDMFDGAQMAGLNVHLDSYFNNNALFDADLRIKGQVKTFENGAWNTGTSGQVLTSQGVGRSPIWSTVQGGGADPATANPLMDGTAAVGTSTKYAREDHVHPSDTNKQDTLVSGTNIKTINGESLLGAGNIDTLNVAVNQSECLTFWYGQTV